MKKKRDMFVVWTNWRFWVLLPVLVSLLLLATAGNAVVTVFGAAELASGKVRYFLCKINTQPAWLKRMLDWVMAGEEG